MEWIQTDDLQFVKKINENEFEIVDVSKLNGKFVVYWDIIGLNRYNDQELESHISGYYESLQKVKELYKDEWKQVVAEIIAENNFEYDGAAFADEETLSNHLNEVYEIKMEV